MSSLQSLQKSLQPGHALFQGLVGAAVGDADVARGAKAAAWDGGHAAFGDEPGAEGFVGETETGNVREYIESALGFREGKTHLRQPAADKGPATGVGTGHFSGVDIQGGNARILNEGGAEDYLKFLSTGGSMYPIDELKIAGVDLTTPEPIVRALKVFEETLDEFEQLMSK
jgi:hypothetical protein